MIGPLRLLVQGTRRRPWRALLVLGCLGVFGWGGAILFPQLRAHSYYRAAQKSLAQGELRQGQKYLERCLLDWPDRVDVQLLAARIARRRDAYEDADRHLAICEELQSVTPASALERALLKAQQGELAGVEAQLKSLAAAQDHPERTLILEALAKGYLSMYRYADALACLHPLVHQEPKNAIAYLLRGRALEKLERDEDALQDYQNALDLTPGSNEVRIALAATLARLGRIREAIGHYEQLYREQPENAEVVLGLARCRQENQELEAAQQLLDRLLVEQPHSVPALLERSRLALHRGQASKAEGWLRQAAALAPEDQDVFFALHLSLQAQGKDAAAQECLAQLRKIELVTAREFTLMARIQESPHDASLRYEIGMIFLNRGQDQEALRWLSGALQEDPRHRPTHVALADYFERTGQPGLAARHRKWLDRGRGDSSG